MSGTVRMLIAGGLGCVGFGCLFFSAVLTKSHLAPRFNWIQAEGTVEQIAQQPSSTQSLLPFTVTLRYQTRQGVRSSPTFRQLWQSRGPLFAESYAVGTHHLVYVSPSDPNVIDLDDWNLETRLGLFFLYALTALLFVSARSFWKSNNP